MKGGARFGALAAVAEIVILLVPTFLRAGGKEVFAAHDEVPYREYAWWSGGTISWTLNIGIR